MEKIGTVSYLILMMRSYEASALALLFSDQIV